MGFLDRFTSKKGKSEKKEPVFAVEAQLRELIAYVDSVNGTTEHSEKPTQQKANTNETQQIEKVQSSKPSVSVSTKGKRGFAPELQLRELIAYVDSVNGTTGHRTRHGQDKPRSSEKQEIQKAQDSQPPISNVSFRAPGGGDKGSPGIF